jgi:putative glutathione S-transferase
LIQPSWKAGDYADKDGQFRRPDSAFRYTVSADPSSQFPTEAGRYHLYVNFGCPWAHRTIITRALKGLEDIIPLAEADGFTEGVGWTFDKCKDTLNGFKTMRELYVKADPAYTGRITVPVLWDSKKRMDHYYVEQSRMLMSYRNYCQQRK